MIPSTEMAAACRLVLTPAARRALLNAAGWPAAVRACPSVSLAAPQLPSWHSFAAAIVPGVAQVKVPPLHQQPKGPAEPPAAHQHAGFPNTAYSTAVLGVRLMTRVLPYPSLCDGEMVCTQSCPFRRMEQRHTQAVRVPVLRSTSVCDKRV